MKKTKRFLKNNLLISLVLSSFIYLELATIRASTKQTTQLIIINLLGILSLWSYLRVVFTSPGHPNLTELHQLSNNHPEDTTHQQSNTLEGQTPQDNHSIPQIPSQAPSPTLILHQSTSDTHHTTINNPSEAQLPLPSATTSQDPKSHSEHTHSDHPSKPAPVFIPPSQHTTAQHPPLTSPIQDQSQKETKPSTLTSPLVNPTRLFSKRRNNTINDAIQRLEINMDFIQFCTNQFTIYFDDQYQLGTSNHAKLCSRCRIFKPPRAHHCRRCNACVLKMDHHCPWVGRCVGAYNYKFFLNFLQWSSFYCITVFILMTIKLVESKNGQRNRMADRFATHDLGVEGARGADEILRGGEEREVLSAVIISGVVMVFISSLLVTHLSLLVDGLTTLEHLADRKFKAELLVQVLQAFPDGYQSAPTTYRARISCFFFRRKLGRIIHARFSLYRQTFLLKYLHHHPHPLPSPSFLSAIHPLQSSTRSLLPDPDSLRFYRANWQSVMGRQPLRWILPIRPAGDYRHSFDPGLPVP
ncbi:hypothetical protein PGTUg99_006720 [Puccinia graminis f. sp. tritici]|uniref:Palmitoyltransferase n=1 Tax=Puccinia graminis f. sp. tritici TaxID=56615 RepID=A0A5B0SA73_PUCGR|nr:hypothetical protein PGTUg99_006720 [Puccinia graminis f. sp. tritici]